MELTHGSLFTGIGGFDLGFERAGFKTIWQVEIDDYATKVLEKNFPGVQRFRDIRTVGSHNLSIPTVITGGFPCQDISVAGKRKGIKGERSGLWKEMLRVVCELRPQFFVVENVAGILISGIGCVLGDICEIGYDAEWQVIPASFVGSPQKRERTFIVAYAQCDGRNKVEIFSATNYESKGKPQEAWGSTRVIPCKDNGRKLWGFPDTDIHRSFDGFPDWVDRLKCLGNAVVPAIAQEIAEMIKTCERQRNALP